ncbi:MAG: TIM barrel protein [Planctomycetaceae bacterium]|nr:TIM barrel protein [Planctomycetaceae bacterium]
MSHPITRRRALQGLALTGATALAFTRGKVSAQEAIAETLKLKGNIRQSVSYWCFGGIPLGEFTDICKKTGLVGIDLLNPDQWETVTGKGMLVTMGNVPGAGIDRGFNSLKEHDRLVECYEATIPKAAKIGVPNLICFSGNRHGLSDEEGLENCVKGIRRILPIAEKHGVTIVLELLNSRVDHHDYQADHTAWAADLVRKTGSENLKLLYDIYHMQIMEGDLIRTIEHNTDVIGHFHTGGNPGRNEIDDTQEIYYPAVMKAILKTGYKGVVAHEFTPKRDDKLASLRQAVKLCDV